MYLFAQYKGKSNKVIKYLNIILFSTFIIVKEEKGNACSLSDYS